MSLKIDLKNNWKKYLGWAWLALSFLALVIFYVARIDYLLDSDMSSEMVLADVLAKSRNIILSKNRPVFNRFFPFPRPFPMLIHALFSYPCSLLPTAGGSHLQAFYQGLFCYTPVSQ